jgi:hypothetical protein
MYLLRVPKNICKNAFGQKNEERAGKNGIEHVSISVFP